MDGWTMLSKGLILQYFAYPLIPEEKIWTILFLRGIGAVSDFSYVCRTYCSCDICWLLVGLFQTVTQLQEQTLPFGGNYCA